MLLNQVRQNFQYTNFQAIRKSLCLPFMFPAWQCRHIRGSLDSSSSSFSSANSLFFSRARTWKIPLYSWLPFFHSSSVQSIVSRLAFIDHPTSLVQTCRDSIAFRLRELPPPTCANDRSRSTRSRPDSRLSNNPRSLFPIHDSSIRPLSPRSCLPPVFPFTKLKYPNDYSVRIYISRGTSREKNHQQCSSQESTVGLQNNEFTICWTAVERITRYTFVRITAFLFPIFPRDNAIHRGQRREKHGYRDREELLSDKLAAVVIDAAPLPVVGRPATGIRDLKPTRPAGQRLRHSFPALRIDILRVVYYYYYYCYYCHSSPGCYRSPKCGTNITCCSRFPGFNTVHWSKLQ